MQSESRPIIYCHQLPFWSYHILEHCLINGMIFGIKGKRKPFHYRRGLVLNRLTPNDPYMGTAPLTSKRCILYIYSTNTGTEYFKHALYPPFFSSSKCSLFHNANLFGSVLFTFYIQGVLKFKKIIPAPKG